MAIVFEDATEWDELGRRLLKVDPQAWERWMRWIKRDVETSEFIERHKHLLAIDEA